MSTPPDLNLSREDPEGYAAEHSIELRVFDRTLAEKLCRVFSGNGTVFIRGETFIVTDVTSDGLISGERSNFVFSLRGVHRI